MVICINLAGVGGDIICDSNFRQQKETLANCLLQKWALGTTGLVGDHHVNTFSRAALGGQSRGFCKECAIGPHPHELRGAPTNQQRPPKTGTQRQVFPQSFLIQIPF